MKKIVISIILALSLVLSSVILSRAIYNLDIKERTVVVKGLSEKVVKSTAAKWELSFSIYGDDETQIYRDFGKYQARIKGFLLSAGFDEKEISNSSFSVRENTDYEKPVSKYTASSSIVVKTDKVDLVSATEQNINVLLSDGIVINNSFIEYMFTGLNDIKEEMVVDSINNAKDTGAQYVNNLDTKIVGIKSANQGLFSINGDYYNMYKNVRVVSTVEFYIK